MSESEKASNMRVASGAGWSEREKIAYLILLCESEGKVEAKIANAPIPAGRSVIACKRLLSRLKEKHKEDIEKIKSGQPLDADTNGETAATPKTPKKRTSKAADGDANEEEGPPKKKATSRKRKNAAAMEEVIKKEVKDEEFDEEEVMEEYGCV